MTKTETDKTIANENVECNLGHFIDSDMNYKKNKIKTGDNKILQQDCTQKRALRFVVVYTNILHEYKTFCIKLYFLSAYIV